MKKIFIQLLIATCLLLPAMALADTFGQGMLGASVQGVGLEQNLENSVANVISTVSTVVGTIFLILTVVAGIMWMTAAGNEERITKAKQILVAAAIGLFVVMSAYTITYFVTKKVGGAPSGGGGSSSEPCCCHYDDGYGLNTGVMDPQVCADTPGYLYCTVDEVDDC